MLCLFRRHATYQLFIACLMCTTLAGQTQLKNKTLTRPMILALKRTEIPNYTSATNATISNQWYDLNVEDKRKVNIVAMSVSAVGAVLNIAVTLAIVIDPLKVLRKGPWITILSLAIADLITCIGGFFLWARAVFFRNPGVPYNGFVDFIWGVGYSASFLMLTFLTVQIFMVTKYPIKSRCWLSTTRIILLGTGHWLLAILLGYSNIAWVHFQLRECLIIYIAQHGILEIAIIIQVGLHIQVAIEIVKSGRHISANDKITKHKKIAGTVIILTMILFFTAFPYFVLKQLEYVARLEHFGRRETGRLFYAIAYYTRPIIMMNFVVNPIIYSLRLPDYRKSLVALIGVRKETEVQENTNEFQLRNRKALEI